MNLPPLLTVDNLHVEFGSHKVLHGVSFEIFKGEKFALIGESGSGKSVTAHSILNLLHHSGRITSGHIYLESNPIKKNANGTKIGMVFQDPMTSLNPTLPIGIQIAEGIVYHESVSWKAAKQRSLDLLKKVGIVEPELRYNSFPFQLSGGLRQRVMIAIAMACRPLLLIADEPTTALDLTVQAQIMELLTEACKENEMSLLLVTHDLGIVAEYCDRMAVMHKGQIVESGSVDRLFESPEQPYTKQLLSIKKNS